MKRETVDEHGSMRLEGDTHRERNSIPDAHAKRLTALAKGRMCLEIGTGTGRSAEAMAETATTVATFDVSDTVRERVWPGLPANVIPYDRRHETLRQGGAGFDLVFVDGDHSESAVLEDIREAFDVMRPDALWVFHDFQQEGVDRAVTQCRRPTFRIVEKVTVANMTMVVCEVAR